jgi:serine-type D-Ala-D-Ala carboxypeptidase (penicillin-binding protein 5/6)
MNETAKSHGLTRSHFAVAHGMNHWENYSSALDIAKLTKIVMRNHSIFVDIVNTKDYCVASKSVTGHIYNWENTNRLLWDTSGGRGRSPFHGVKTGNTSWAGPCLCVNYRDEGFDFIIVVLNCKTPEARFIEVPKLCRWAVNKILRVRRTNLRPAIKKRLLRNMVHV